jgi:DNA-binding MarR family transcriptional regulator
VQRSPDPADRRGVLVGLTAAGRRTVDAAFEELLRREQALLESLSEEDRARLAGLLKTLMSPFR